MNRRSSVGNQLRRDESRLAHQIAAEEGQLSQVGKRGEAMSDDEASQGMADQEVGLGVSVALMGTLDEVHQALHKLDAGTYGICDDCGQPIPADRLKAMPKAALCLACKVQRERGASRNFQTNEVGA
ncbi:MAG: TraR/DksA C4-type zinc finger protein [Chloroflexota bacterium]|nr:TraR/DksA C4-type zinc finger protein [Chloroflexota bacterium]